jgi:hypothetical protein
MTGSCASITGVSSDGALSKSNRSSRDVSYLPPDGLKPSTGTILDLLDSRAITWTDYYEVGPQAGALRRPSDTTDPPLPVCRGLSYGRRRIFRRGAPASGVLPRRAGRRASARRHPAWPGVRLAGRQCNPEPQRTSTPPPTPCTSALSTITPQPATLGHHRHEVPMRFAAGSGLRSAAEGFSNR